MIALDTNVFVRYLTDDDARPSPAATRFIEESLSPERPGCVGLVTLAELAWALKSRHRASASEVMVVIEELASDARFSLQDSHAVWLALDMAESAGADLPDAMLAALASVNGCTNGVVFDKSAARLPGMRALAVD